MNRILQRIGLLTLILVAAITSFTASGYDFEQNGICYTFFVSENNRVEVKVSGYSQDISPILDIPEQVTYESKQYEGVT